MVNDMDIADAVENNTPYEIKKRLKWSELNKNNVLGLMLTNFNFKTLNGA